MGTAVIEVRQSARQMRVHLLADTPQELEQAIAEYKTKFEDQRAEFLGISTPMDGGRMEAIGWRGHMASEKKSTSV